MCFLSVVFLSAFLAGVLSGGAITVSVVMLMLGWPAASIAVLWGGGVMGSLAVIATFFAWRMTQKLCTYRE